MAITEEAMVARARAMVDAFSREDFDRAIELLHPEAVLARPGGLPQLRGRAAARKWMEPDALESQKQELVQAEPVGPRTLLTRNRVMARGAGSGMEMDNLVWCVWTFDDDGLLTRFEYFLDQDEAAARDAAGRTD